MCRFKELPEVNDGSLSESLICRLRVRFPVVVTRHIASGG